MATLMKNLQNFAGIALALALGIVFSSPIPAADHSLPEPTSPEFCKKAQHILANTEIDGKVTLFDNMPDYRASKPAPDPLLIYQVVTYEGALPVAVSCKVKAADHLRATFGEDAAGEQLACPVINEMVREQAVAELEAAGNAEAAEVARNFIIDQNEPYWTGQEYLSDFELSYLDPEARIHLQSPGLQVDWDNLWFWILPNRIRGQTYCHLPTVDYMKALATGEMEPGLVITTGDGATVTPSS